jgi:DNA-directed RNA polymerase specialized sigma24 family protein
MKKQQKNPIQAPAAEANYDDVTRTIRRMVAKIKRRMGVKNSPQTTTSDYAQELALKALELDAELAEYGVRPLAEVYATGWRDAAEERGFVRACNKPLERMMLDRVKRRNALKRGGGAGIEALENRHLENVTACADERPEWLEEVAALLREFEAARDKRERDIVLSHFFQGHSLKQLASTWEIGDERVRQIRAEALAWMRARLAQRLGQR